MELHDRLIAQDPLHATPAEHAAKALDWPAWYLQSLKYHADALGIEPERPDPIKIQNMVVEALRAPDRRSIPNNVIMYAAVALQQIRSGNFMGFEQYRKMLPNEYIGGLRP